jgi:hypothetical protein
VPFVSLYDVNLAAHRIQIPFLNTFNWTTPTGRLPHLGIMSISVVIVEPGPDVRTTQSMQHSHTKRLTFLEVLNVLRTSPSRRYATA